MLGPVGSHRQEVEALRRQREHSEIMIRYQSPKFGPGNFSNSITTGSTVYSIESNSLRVTYREPACLAPSVNVLNWDGKKFDWLGSAGFLAPESVSERVLPLSPGSAESWLQSFFGSLPRPSVSVGFKFGARRRQAKVDRALVRDQPCFLFPTNGIANAYEELVAAGQQLSKSALGVTHHGEIYLDPLTGRKGFGGATKLVANGALTISTAIPDLASTNFVALLFQVEQRNIFLLPHIAVVQSGSTTFGRSYDAVRLEVSEWQTQVDSVPHGAEFLGYVWRFMNKDGGPDRRYNDNYQIPVIRSWEIDFHIRDVGELHLAFSSRDAVFSFKSAFEKFSSLLT